MSAAEIAFVPTIDSKNNPNPHTHVWTVYVQPTLMYDPETQRTKVGQVRWNDGMEQFCFHTTVSTVFFTQNALLALADALKDLNDAV